MTLALSALGVVAFILVVVLVLWAISKVREFREWWDALTEDDYD